MAKFSFSRVHTFDSMANIDLRVYKGFGRENRSGRNFTLLVIVHDQIPYDFEIYYPHKIKFSNAKITKICSQAKIWC